MVSLFPSGPLFLMSGNHARNLFLVNARMAAAEIANVERQICLALVCASVEGAVMRTLWMGNKLLIKICEDKNVSCLCLL